MPPHPDQRRRALVYFAPRRTIPFGHESVTSSLGLSPFLIPTPTGNTRRSR